MKKGEITVFLSIVFVLLLSFTTGILEAAVVQTSKNRARLTMDRAIFSLFGEYNKELLDKYHIFALEGSYGTGTYREENLIKRMHYYGAADIQSEVSDIQYLTDQNAQGYREQVLEYMEQRTGISLVQDLSGIGAEWEEQEIQGKELKEKEENLLDEYDSALEEYEESEEMESDPEDSGDLPIPYSEVNGELFSFLDTMKQNGILSLILPNNMDVSNKEINLESQVSNRERRTGRGTFYGRADMNGIKERLLFDEYIMRNFDCAVSEYEEQNNASDSEMIEKSLAYEIEYILSGKQSDKSNLEAVLMKIFLIRLSLNYAYLARDSVKQSEARTLAAALALLLLMPELEEVFCQLILLAWSTGESIVDLRTLMSGKKAALAKTSETWQLPLSALFLLGTPLDHYDGGSDQQDGISYQTYLRGFLVLKNTEDLAMKMLDRIEENINGSAENHYFKADQCITKVRFNSKVQILGAITYQFPVYFGYE